MARLHLLSNQDLQLVDHAINMACFSSQVYLAVQSHKAGNSGQSLCIMDRHLVVFLGKRMSMMGHVCLSCFSSPSIWLIVVARSEMLRYVCMHIQIRVMD